MKLLIGFVVLISTLIPSFANRDYEVKKFLKEIGYPNIPSSTPNACTYYGSRIVCENGEVVTIDLTNVGVSGYGYTRGIPERITKFPHLKNLKLGGNYLMSLTYRLEEMKNLQTLEVDQNSLMNIIGLRNLEFLKYVKLGQNGMYNTHFGYTPLTLPNVRGFEFDGTAVPLIELKRILVGIIENSRIALDDGAIVLHQNYGWTCPSQNWFDNVLGVNSKLVSCK
eukprot:TRINITY_DN4981_c0_g1_i1.p1 TRINITY_DN4981_c0_g1~~TRINITY_DN4981_c0_g1_i1.p1  ORF type:complete len:224 (+),score=48.76 TRINITY_DN4981_c0_g1_i1:226-897(+)